MYSIKALTVKWGHYSPTGHRIISKYINAHLNEWGFTDLPELKETIQKEQERLGLSSQ